MDSFGRMKGLQVEYFWKQQDDIPKGMGYPLFGTAHLISVAVTLFCVVIICICFIRWEREKQNHFLKSIPIIMAVLELSKDLFLITVHRFGVGYLPLHICSIGIFVFLLREYLPYEKAKRFFGEIAYILIMPASLVALFDADWTYLYPVWNFINLHSYVWHGLLILYSVLLRLRGEVSPTIRHIHWVLLFLCLIIPPVYVFDKIFNCNYFFINWPIPNSPLSLLAAHMGNPGYLIGYAILTILVILGMYGFIWLTERLIGKRQYNRKR